MLLRYSAPKVRTWGYVTREGVSVGIAGIKNAEAPTDQEEMQAGPTFLLPSAFADGHATEILLRARLQTGLERVGTSQVRVLDEPREAAERALSEMALVLGIQSEQPWTLVSPKPYMLLVAETDADREVLAATGRIVLPQVRVRPVKLGRGLGDPLSLAVLLEDRPDGLTLLGAAVRSGGGIAKLHELFRVFENGFKRAGLSLLDPLTDFLSSYPEWDLGYTREEVKFWIEELRHPATHADLKRSSKLVFDAEADRYIPRIEQAAFDVLYNKERWHSGDSKRLMRWALEGGRLLNGSTIAGPGAVVPTAGHLDHFGTFSLNESYSLNLDLSGTAHLWATWYYPEEDWDRFAQEIESGPEHELEGEGR